MEIDTKLKVEIKKDFNDEERHANLDSVHTINLYKNPPFGQLTLEECEDLFRQRLEALHIMEMTPDMTDVTLATTTNALREIRSFVYKTNCILLRATDKHQQKLDHFSHMLVRMYCVLNPNLWDWFKSSEKKLFYYRLRDQASSLSGGQLESILRSFSFNFERVVGSELSQLIREDLIGWNKQRDTDKDALDIFKVKFTDALKFIAKRSVSLKDGYAFLTRREIISVVCDVFDRHLTDELHFARQHLNIELMQTQQLMENLTIVFEDFDEKVKEEKKKARREQGGDSQNPYKLDIENVDEISKVHFPPCMRFMHETLREDHHHRHQARMYYGAFLRSCGVDMDSAIEFWRKEFTKKIPVDKFDRDYKYNIRHLYGKEGHKKALSSFSCDKIINSNAPGVMDKHGCPFKHFDETNLKNTLVKHGLRETDIESIMSFKKDNEYSLACSHHFKFTRGELPSEPIKNPSQYYYESMRL